MPTLYTRATVLRSVGGRIHYITSPERQAIEEIKEAD